MTEAPITTEAFEVHNRWTGSVQFTAQIALNIPTLRLKLGAAIRWAFSSDADLRDAVLRGADLRDADLRDADLSGAVLRDANLRGADLRDAVLRGADLRDADLRDADLSDAVLRGADLRGADLSGADLSDAVLRGADLRGADLSGAVLSGADLRDANLRDADLSGAVLSGADLRDADLRGIPVIPNIDASIVAAVEAGGRLKMDAWHTCGTSHCRAGWAIHLAGDAGYKLEAEMGSEAAGALIYAASRPGEPVPNFYATDAGAMADLRAAAAKSSGEGIVA